MTTNVRAVLFDAAGVLTAPFSFELVEAAIAAGAAADVLVEVLLPIFSEAGDGDSVGNRLERGEVSLEDFLVSLGDAEPHIRKVIDPTESTFFGATWGSNQAMHDFVVEVHDAGFVTALVSNNVREWQPTWDRIVPATLPFDARVFSWEIGARKPERAMYTQALDALGVEPAEALFIDDFAAMAQGARDLGMLAIDFVDAESAIAEARGLLGLEERS